MRFLRAINRSVRRKVMAVCLGTTLAALVLSGIGLSIYDARSYRRGVLEDLRTQAEVIAIASAPALVFDDQLAARENLAALRARHQIVAAALYRDSGEKFAAFVRNGRYAAPDRLVPAPASGHRIADGLLVVQEAVSDAWGNRIGIVEVRSVFQPFARLLGYLYILLVVMLASTAIALLLSARLQRTITGPIVGMADLARRIVERRDYSLRAVKSTDDELATLVDAMNAMLRDIEQEMQVRVAAEAALREADTRKDQFLATLAHELRNPLAALAAASRLLSLAADNPRAMAVARETLTRQVNHMARLLEDLLDVSRITRGKLALKKGPASLGSLVEAAVETARPLLDEKEHRLGLDLHDPGLMLDVDAVRLAQVITNLLTNAAKYTDRGGDIRVVSRREDDELVLSVRDNGIGLAPESLPHIFDMFSQVNPAPNRSQSGLGIGLALARGLAELHGGTLEAYSEGPGRGSEFVLRLPVGPLSACTSVAAPASAPGSALRLLVADDNQDALVSLSMLLEMDGHRIATAGDGAEALRVAESFQPDVALLDIGMPKMSGYEVARRLRDRLPADRLMLVAITGWGQAEDKRRAAEAGFDHHLTKPVDLELLRRLLRDVAERRAGTSRAGRPRRLPAVDPVTG